ncbi:MAG: YlcI/YnfO family protein [Acidovorax sp.]|uniref:YlcI/YnfO family protein n=1 Tax=Acidovorax sp. TaxID=1872122 RepID=UPI0039E3F258
MKTTSLPSLRVSPQLRQDTEAVLLEGESLSQFIESAVRGQVALRRAQADFLARGIASRDRAREHGRYVPANEVIGKLRASLQAAQTRRGEHA